MLGVAPTHRGIQAVWVRVVNRSPSGTRLLLTKIAPDYYTAREAAGLCHFSLFTRLLTFGLLIWFFLPILLLALPFKLLATRRANGRMIECFQSVGFPLKNIAPGAVAEGIVFTPLEFGTHVVDVALVINMQVKEYLFSLDVPAPHVDHSRTLAVASAPGTTIDCDLASLQRRLTEMPPATTNARGTRTGDPVNLVIIGDFAAVIGVFAARWDQTEIITLGSCWRTVKAFLLGSEYRYSPVSALHLFGRPQDFALQRVRASINERLHLRLWCTPLRVEGQTVWVGRSAGISASLDLADLESDHPPHRFRRRRSPRLRAGGFVRGRPDRRRRLRAGRRPLRSSFAAAQPDRRSLLHRRQPRGGYGVRGAPHATVSRLGLKPAPRVAPGKPAVCQLP